MKIKVLNLEENGVIGFRKAFYRESVWFFISLTLIVYFIFNINSTSYSASEYLMTYDDINAIISLSWLAIELITMLTNNKRRAIHDFMAGSVIVKTSKQELQ